MRNERLAARTMYTTYNICEINWNTTQKIRHRKICWRQVSHVIWLLRYGLSEKPLDTIFKRTWNLQLLVSMHSVPTGAVISGCVARTVESFFRGCQKHTRRRINFGLRAAHFAIWNASVCVGVVQNHMHRHFLWDLPDRPNFCIWQKVDNNITGHNILAHFLFLLWLLCETFLCEPHMSVLMMKCAEPNKVGNLIKSCISAFFFHIFIFSAVCLWEIVALFTIFGWKIRVQENYIFRTVYSLEKHCRLYKIYRLNMYVNSIK